MTTEKFTPRPPVPVCWGFEAGVLRIAWAREPAFEIASREGLVFTATITECHTDREILPSAIVTAALQGLVVRSPAGILARIAGVEAHCTMIQPRGAVLGLLLVPVEEP